MIIALKDVVKFVDKYQLSLDDKCQVLETACNFMNGKFEIDLDASLYGGHSTFVEALKSNPRIHYAMFQEGWCKVIINELPSGKRLELTFEEYEELITLYQFNKREVHFNQTSPPERAEKKGIDESRR